MPDDITDCGRVHAFPRRRSTSSPVSGGEHGPARAAADGRIRSDARLAPAACDALGEGRSAEPYANIGRVGDGQPAGSPRFPHRHAVIGGDRTVAIRPTLRPHRPAATAAGHPLAPRTGETMPLIPDRARPTARTACRRAAALVLFCAAAIAHSAAQAAPPDPASARDALAYYDQWLGYQQGYQRIPGIQAAIRIDGELAFSASYGQADVERRRPLRNDDLFRIASHSKTFAAIAVLQLVEAGKLRLDDTAGHWLPWLAQARSPLASATVADLLSHSAGVIRDGRDSDFWQLGKPFPDREQLREELLTAEASVIPGNEHFKYSNIGYGLIGLIVEAATGEDFNAYASREIVGRLGLAHTGPEYDPARADEYATGYSSLLYADHRVPIEHVDTRALSAATGFYANAEDLTAYFSAYRFGDARLIGDASKRRMFRPVWSGKPGDESASIYGLGVFVHHVGARTLVGHSGGYPGHITISMADPEDAIAVSVLTNALGSPVSDLAKTAYRLIDLAERTRQDADTPAVPAGIDLDRFTGRFARLWGVIDIAALGGRLYMLNPYELDPAKSAVPLTVIDATTLRVDGGTGGNHYKEPVVYAFDAQGKVESVRISGTYLPIDDWAVPERVRKAY